MVEMIKSLLPTKKLKTTMLQNHRGGVHVFYDRDNDILLVQIVTPDVETVVHYIDDGNVALLYESDTKEIVGLHIEGFKTTFLPQHDGVAKAWSTTIQVRDFGDLVLRFEEMQPVIAKEVVEASRPVIEQKNIGLATLLNKSFAGVDNYVAA